VRSWTPDGLGRIDRADGPGPVGAIVGPDIVAITLRVDPR
jgi:hypothetical protein